MSSKLVFAVRNGLCWRKALGGLLSFSLFVFGYYLPLILDMPRFDVADPRIRILLKDMLSVPSVQWEVVRNVLAHLLLLGLAYWLLTALSSLLASAIRIDRRIARVLVLFAGWVFILAANSVLFPKSDYSFAFDTLAQPVLAYSLAAIFLVGLLTLATRACRARRWLPMATASASVAALAVASLPVFGTSNSRGPNIIIVGVDSLSAHVFGQLRESLPNLSQLMQSGTTYGRAYTPLGRTYPAWMSILSGRSPAEHGAIENLRNLDAVQKNDLISKILEARGYRTVFAIDERRFNNIDESFGFDRVVGPRVGALDFVMQRFNDTPLTNILLQLPLASALLPYSYVNTQSYANYDADGFVRRVLDATSDADKLFLAVHFESAHFPYRTRHSTRSFEFPNEFLNSQGAALTAVDAQVGELMADLKRRGFLNDALVIVLSDHGEGLGELEATVTQGGITSEVRGYGHGADIVSDHENHIVLGVAKFAAGRAVPVAVRERRDQVSLLDVRPLIAQYVANGAATIQPRSNCMPVESAVRLTAKLDYKKLDEAALASSAAENYEIDAVGRLRLRESYIPKLIESKDVGWRCADRLTYYSYTRKSYFSYALDDAGMPAKEVQPTAEDVEQIDSYRRRLMRVAHE